MAELLFVRKLYDLTFAKFVNKLFLVLRIIVQVSLCNLFDDGLDCNQASKGSDGRFRSSELTIGEVLSSEKAHFIYSI